GNQEAAEYQPAQSTAENRCHLISAPITWDLDCNASSNSADRAVFFKVTAYSTTCVPSASWTTPLYRHFLRKSSNIDSTIGREPSGSYVRNRSSTSRRC